MGNVQQRLDEIGQSLAATCEVGQKDARWLYHWVALEQQLLNARIRDLEEDNQRLRAYTRGQISQITQLTADIAKARHVAEVACGVRHDP